MGNAVDRFYKSQSLLYKGFVYVLSVVLVVFFFPRSGQFKYEFQKGKPWAYENLHAPIDFTLKKTEDEIAIEKQSLKDNREQYYDFSEGVVQEVKSNLLASMSGYFATVSFADTQRDLIENRVNSILDQLYSNGIFETRPQQGNIFLIRNNQALPLLEEGIADVERAKSRLNTLVAPNEFGSYRSTFIKLGSDALKANVMYNRNLTDKALEEDLSKISLTRGAMAEGELIIAKGEVVENNDYKVLNSLKEEYESELWKGNNYYYILAGYAVLVALVLIMLMLFLRKYRTAIYTNNTKVTFIFVNILLMVFITTLMVQHQEAYLYAVPLCILPLILKNFFDARLGLFVHVLTVLILGFVVPNSFEYIFLQIIAGIVTILTASELYKRANLFISVGQITLIYIVGYVAFYSIQEGNLSGVSLLVFAIFLLNGMLTLFAQPLIYIYEKIFGLVSDVSLLELSDTNSKLLKELANEAPGTFHHSLQVANLAEAAANEIGANAMLVRVGALYHDIGKMKAPTYFTENQVTNVNPHDDLPPKESAKIIIDHVIRGIEIARKNKLPDRVIDFLRTHHGTSTVRYFYRKQQEIEPEADVADFTYPGPIPFSKETAILMMSDAVEAASKSLKNPTYLIIHEFVDKIIEGQMVAQQFLNADITFKEIEQVKKVLKQKLTNIYHLRVEYPE